MMEAVFSLTIEKVSGELQFRGIIRGKLDDDGCFSHWDQSLIVKNLLNISP